MAFAAKSWFSRFKLGFKISLKSLDFVFNNLKLLMFPLLGLILITGCIALVDFVYYQINSKHITSYFVERVEKIIEEHEQKNSSTQDKDKDIEFNFTTAEIVSYLIFIFLIIFVFGFLGVALSHAASNGMANKPIKIVESLKFAFTRLPTIFVWSVCAFIIHIIISTLRGKNDKEQNAASSSLGGLIELGWAIATFFVTPVIANESLGAFKSIKRSASLMKKTFGENIGATFSFGLIGLLAFVLSAFIVLGSGKILDSYFISHPYQGQFPTFLIVIIVIALASIFMIFQIISVTKVVFKTAIYNYAVGKPSNLFTTQEINHAFHKAAR